MAALPNKIEDLSGEWLDGALRRSGQIATDAGGEVELKSAETLGTGSAYSTVMYRLELAGPEGTPASAVVKLPVGGQIRPLLDAIGAYRRELTFYTELSEDVPVRVPRAYVAEMAEDSTDFVLLIEDLSGLEPADQLAGLTVGQTETAVDDLARFHAWSWEHERLEGLADRFPPLDGPVGRGVQEQLGQFLTMAWPAAREVPEMISDEVGELGQRWPGLVPDLIERLAAPRTIAHGELRADNLFLTPEDGLLMLDFQTVAQQAGIIDVAYLVTTSVPAEVRRGNDEALVRRYADGLAAAGVSDYPFERAWEQYRLALVLNLGLSAAAFTQYELSDERGKALLIEMLRRADSAIRENGSLELIEAVSPAAGQ